MELQQLLYFQHVAHSENMTRSASDLHISQPSLSKVIRVLEQELGVLLFDRRGRKIALNEKGRLFLRRVETVLNELKEARSELQAQDKEVKGTLHFYFDVASSVIPDVIRSFRLLYPEVTFELDQHYGAPSSPRFDLCVTSMPVGLRGTEKVDLLKEELLLAVPLDNPLAVQSSIRLDQIADEGLICLRKGNSLRELADALCKTAGFVPKISFESDDPATVRGLIRAGQGIALVPSLTWPGTFDETIKLLKLENPNRFRTIELHWKKDHPLGLAAQTFRLFLIDYFSKLPHNL
ncbi:LysR family transcriptional regulator [Gorillibacterium sp. CAU 1737]|uniref:LysR family transcriptional regulator n=1 Tax=Gorillibacterium sp. CAU 1737 TaxID=3140362 RepID=UPI0032605FA6